MDEQFHMYVECLHVLYLFSERKIQCTYLCILIMYDNNFRQNFLLTKLTSNIYYFSLNQSYLDLFEIGRIFVHTSYWQILRTLMVGHVMLYKIHVYGINNIFWINIIFSCFLITTYINFFDDFKL